MAGHTSTLSDVMRRPSHWIVIVVAVVLMLVASTVSIAEPTRWGNSSSSNGMGIVSSKGHTRVGTFGSMQTSAVKRPCCELFPRSLDN